MLIIKKFELNLNKGESTCHQKTIHVVRKRETEMGGIEEGGEERRPDERRGDEREEGLRRERRREDMKNEEETDRQKIFLCFYVGVGISFFPSSTKGTGVLHMCSPFQALGTGLGTPLLPSLPSYRAPPKQI